MQEEKNLNFDADQVIKPKARAVYVQQATKRGTDMDALILIVGCAFIAGMVAAFMSGSFFLSVMVAIMLSGQTLAVYYMKLGSQTGDWFIFLALPLMLIAAITGGAIGMVLADPAYDSGINPNDIV